MTKEFIETQIKRAIDRANMEQCVYRKEYAELADYLSQHPVMQEGKEKVYSPPHGLASRLPVDDEQPEGKWYTTGASLRICPTCFKEYACLTTGSQDCPNCTPRSSPPNDPGAHSMNIV